MSAVEAEGWVLAGGRSLRMGRDKAALEFAGAPLLECTLGKLRRLGLRARVAGIREPVVGVDAEIVSDLHPDCGPLSGLETALSRSEMPLVLILGVDLPLIETEFLRWMLERALVSGAIATVPRVLGEPQPLCAVYRRELLDIVSQALASGDYKVMTAVARAAEKGRVYTFDAERVATAGAWESLLPVHCQFMNCNRPEDVTTASAWLRKALC